MQSRTRAVVLLLLFACDRRTTTPPEPPPACGSGGERFAEYGFVPPTVRAAARLRLDDPSFDASLSALTEAARGEGHGLPIDLAFAIGQWSWQVPLVRSTLQRAGHRPSELLYLQTSTGISAWAWPSSCDLAVHTDAAKRGWSLAVKPSAYGAVARGGETFAYDVLYYRDAFVALAPAGQAPALAQSLAAVPVGSEGPAPGDVLASAAAPIHLLVRGRSLVDPAVEADGEPLRQLAATPEGLRPVE